MREFWSQLALLHRLRTGARHSDGEMCIQLMAFRSRISREGRRYNGATWPRDPRSDREVSWLGQHSCVKTWTVQYWNAHSFQGPHTADAGQSRRCSCYRWWLSINDIQVRHRILSTVHSNEVTHTDNGTHCATYTATGVTRHSPILLNCLVNIVVEGTNIVAMWQRDSHSARLCLYVTMPHSLAGGVQYCTKIPL